MTGERQHPRVHVIQNAAQTGGLADWGAVATPVRGASHTRGVLLYRGADGSPEAGIWECTPGVWECRVTRDEFCHFLAGRCVYTHQEGERVKISAGDIALFPAGWSGVCEVIETVRKAYMIR